MRATPADVTYGKFVVVTAMRMFLWYLATQGRARRPPMPPRPPVAMVRRRPGAGPRVLGRHDIDGIEPERGGRGPVAVARPIGPARGRAARGIRVA
jgi:hypothetical protein